MIHNVKTNLDPFLKSLLDFDFLPQPATTTTPRVNISENEAAYQISLAVPGYKKEDLKIKIEQDVLTLSAEIKAETDSQEKVKKMNRKEFEISSFTRRFNLPEKIMEDQIKASFELGILEIILPKAKKVETVKNILID